MSFQGLCLSESFTTQHTDLRLLLPMDQFMSLQVVSVSIQFNTVLTDISLFPLWINSCIFKSPALIKDLPLKVQTFDFSQFWINLWFIMWPKMSLLPNMRLCVSCGFAVNNFGKEKDHAKHNGEYGRSSCMEATMKALLPDTQNN